MARPFLPPTITLTSDEARQVVGTLEDLISLLHDTPYLSVIEAAEAAVGIIVEKLYEDLESGE